MKKRLILILKVLFFVIALFMDLSVYAKDKCDCLYQISTINALLNCVYDTDETIKSLKAKGNFGIGTLNGVDGEMVVLDGKFYQITSEGKVNLINNSAKTPYAVVSYFRPNHKLIIKGVYSFDELKNLIDKAIETKNNFYAIKVKGFFRYIKARSVPRQLKPYLPLAEVVADKQVIFEYRDLNALLVGFRSPEYSGNITVPGFHLHTVDEKRLKGGHLLDCVVENPVIEIDTKPCVILKLPQNKEFFELESGETKENDLNRVEK